MNGLLCFKLSPAKLSAIFFTVNYNNYNVKIFPTSLNVTAAANFPMQTLKAARKETR